MKSPTKVESNKHMTSKLLVGVLVLLLCSIGITVYTMYYGYVASGNDIWGHLFKSNFLYQQIQQGDYFPLYTKSWYNGMQPFRYWAPLPYYILAFLQWLAGGEVLRAYCFFTGFAFFIGGLGWLLWGKSTKRVLLCTVLGILWFFLPENFRVFFCEGNLPRMVCTILTPYLVYFVWCYMKSGRIRTLFGVAIITVLTVFSHVMLAAMAGIATFLFLMLYSRKNKVFARMVQVIVTMLCSFLICGIWLVPALSGGLVGMDPETSATVMSSLTYALSTSINPINRITGIVDTFYYGISIVLVSVFGILFAKKRQKSGYYLAIIILLLTTSSAIPLLSKIPLSQLLWMMRFATLAYAFFLWSFIEWKSLRRYLCVILIAIMVIDIIPSTNISRYYTQAKDRTADEIATVKQNTKQRVSIMDLSAYGSYPSFGLCNGENSVDYTFGWAWQGATTASNIVMLNTAMEHENYIYLFDRSIELGNDTVVIRKDLVGKAGKTEDDMLSAASRSNYSLLKETNDTYIFNRVTPKQFGIVTNYEGISIGKYAKTVELYYPSFTTGSNTCLDEYSLDELSQYKVVFLSGFTYKDMKKAEELVAKLGHQGVRVLVDMTHVPVDPKTNRMHFMGVSVQDISFETRFPTLYYNSSAVSTLDFSQEDSTWNTSYIEGVQNVMGSFHYSNQTLPYIGVNEDKNVVFIGLNLMYHCTQTNDKNMFSVFSNLMQVGLEEPPRREIVPIKVESHNNEITIESDRDHVNTSLAYLDTFQIMEGTPKEYNHLLYVGKGKTVIKVQYPMFRVGLAASIAGVFLLGGFFTLLLLYRRRNRGGKNEQE